MDQQEALKAALIFKVKMEVNDSSDSEIRLRIRTLKAILLERQQVRATKRYLANHPK